MNANNHTDISNGYSNHDIERELERIEATRRLYGLFEEFLDDHRAGEIDVQQKKIYLKAEEVDELLDPFIEEYGESFLEANPELEPEDLEFYRAQSDDFRHELIYGVVREHLSEDTYFEADMPDRDRIEPEKNHSAARAAGKVLVAGGLVLGAMTGLAAAEPYGHNIGGDTDGDGISDIHELQMLGSDPGHRDIFVEVDYNSSCDLNHSYFEDVEEMFDEAPIENPDGTTGINLHVIVDDELELNESVYFGEHEGPLNDRPEIKAENFDNAGSGYHYAVIVEKVAGGNGRSLGKASRGNVLVRCASRRRNGVQHTFTHELGHSLGIFRGDFEGVDSKNLTFDQYPSAMNYNDPEGRGNTFIGYSDGTNSPRDFDDWGYIEQNQYTPDIEPEPNVSESREG